VTFVKNDTERPKIVVSVPEHAHFGDPIVPPIYGTYIDERHTSL